MSRSEVLRASPRMFDSDLLDKLSRVHPIVPPLLFVPAIVVLLVEGFFTASAGSAPPWLLGGYLFWTLTEYWLHRLVFHFEPQRGIGARLHWIIHGVHHDHPNDPLRLVMPPSVSVPLSALFVLGFYAVLGSPAFLPFGAGFLRATSSTTCCTTTCTITRRRPGSAGRCASSTCATTSRTTSAATA